MPCDAGRGGRSPPAARLAGGAANNRIVIYELPTAWTTHQRARAILQIGVGTFRDVARARRPGGTAARTSPASPPSQRPQPPGRTRRQCPGTAAGGRQLRRAGVGLRDEQLLRPGLRPRVSRPGTPRRPPNADLVALVERLPRPRHPLHHRRGHGVRHPRPMENVNFAGVPHRPGGSPDDPERVSVRAAKGCATASAASSGATAAPSPGTTR